MLTVSIREHSLDMAMERLHYRRCHSTNSTWVEVTDTTYVPWCMLLTGLRKPFVPSCGAFSLKMPLYIDMYMLKKAPGKS